MFIVELLYFINLLWNRSADGRRIILLNVKVLVKWVNMNHRLKYSIANSLVTSLSILLTTLSIHLNNTWQHSFYKGINILMMNSESEFVLNSFNNIVLYWRKICCTCLFILILVANPTWKNVTLQLNISRNKKLLLIIFASYIVEFRAKSCHTLDYGPTAYRSVSRTLNFNVTGLGLKSRCKPKPPPMVRKTR